MQGIEQASFDIPLNKKMKKLCLSFICVFAFGYVAAQSSQLYIKTEYIGTSNLLDNNGNRVEGNKGAALVYKGGINLPFSTKINKNSQPVIWGVGISASYTSFNNGNISKNLVLSEMLGTQITLYHIRPLNKKWSMMVILGLGIYTSNTKLSAIRYRNILGNIGTIFIKKLKPNLEVGFGIAMNNTFGYPMIFPALYFNWIYEGYFTFNLSMMDGGTMSAKYNINKKTSLSLIAEMNGQGTMLKRDKQEMMFSHQYIVAGLRPEIKINNHFSISLTIGASIMRSASYNKRSLKGFFSNSSTESDFTESFYISGGFKIGF